MQRADPHFFVRTQIVIQIKRSEFCPDHGVLAWRVVQVSLGHCIAVCLISGFRMCAQHGRTPAGASPATSWPQ